MAAADRHARRAMRAPRWHRKPVVRARRTCTLRVVSTVAGVALLKPRPQPLDGVTSDTRGAAHVAPVGRLARATTLPLRPLRRLEVPDQGKSITGGRQTDANGAHPWPCGLRDAARPRAPALCGDCGARPWPTAPLTGAFSQRGGPARQKRRARSTRSCGCADRLAVPALRWRLQQRSFW